VTYDQWKLAAPPDWEELFNEVEDGDPLEVCDRPESCETCERRVECEALCDNQNRDGDRADEAFEREGDR